MSDEEELSFNCPCPEDLPALPEMHCAGWYKGWEIDYYRKELFAGESKYKSPLDRLKEKMNADFIKGR